MTELRQGPTPRVRFNEVSIKREPRLYFRLREDFFGGPLSGEESCCR